MMRLGAFSNLDLSLGSLPTRRRKSTLHYPCCNFVPLDSFFTGGLGLIGSGSLVVNLPDRSVMDNRPSCWAGD